MYSKESLEKRKELFKEFLNNVSIDDIKTNKQFDKIIDAITILIKSYKKEK